MSNLTTRAMLERCFSDESNLDSFRNKKSNIVKPLLFEYEQEIGKMLVEMDREDIIELIFRYAKGDKKYQPYIAPATVTTLTWVIGKILDWYNRKCDKTYQNVLKDYSGSKADDILWSVVNKAGRITYQDLQSIIKKLHDDPIINYSINGTDYTRADYFELVMLLFYSGFDKAQEIIDVTEIDIVNKTCELADRTITLTDRAFELLTAFHNQGVLAIPNGNSVIQHKLCSWHDSYFKFIVQNGKVDKFNDRDEGTIRTLISRDIKFWVGDKYSTGICADALYWLGVHDRLAAIFSEEELSKIIFDNDSKNSRLFTKVFKQEIPYRKSLNKKKKCLLQFIDLNIALSSL